MHQGPVYDIHCTGVYVITGGKDGKAHFFAADGMERLFTIDLSTAVQSMLDVQVTSLRHNRVITSL